MARRRRARTWTCEYCATFVEDEDSCPSCDLYNAAVAAINAAAIALAESRVKGFNPKKKHRAWINEHGCFAQLDTTIEVASSHEIDCFAELTSMARQVNYANIRKVGPRVAPPAKKGKANG